jgi:hypothetical protein
MVGGGGGALATMAYIKYPSKLTGFVSSRMTRVEAANEGEGGHRHRRKFTFFIIVLT